MRDNDRHNRDRMQLMERLYSQFYRRLYLYAMTFVSDADDAGDIVSDLFSDLWQQWQMTVEVNPPPSNYLYTSVRNRCLDWLRHNKVHANYIRLAEATAETFDNVEEVEAYERRIAEISRIISTLPEPKRSVLNCCYFKHLTYRQAAEQLGLSTVSVKKHIMGVFKMLRKALKNNKVFIL